MYLNSAAPLFLIAVCSCLALASCNTVSGFSNSVSSIVKRQPFASPESPESMRRNYIRAKRQVPRNVQDFQDYLMATKRACGAEMGYKPEELQKSFLYEQLPTPRDKCLMMCVLKKTKIMDGSNKVSSRTIGRIASMLSNNNVLVVSVAMATADNCSRSITATEPCEAASQINSCIAKEMKANKMKIFY